MRNFGSVLAAVASLSVLSVTPSQADGIFVSSILDTYETHSDDPDFWDHQNDRAQTVVRSGEYVGAKAMEMLFRKFEGRSGPMKNLVIFGGSLVNFQFQAANAIMFGHEYAHFAMADHIGLRDHYFAKDGGGEEFSFIDGYLSTLFRGGPGGPATSRGSFDPTIPPRERIAATMAGLNWQMNYSEEWLRGSLVDDGKHVFSWPGFVANRSKTLTYTIGDTRFEGRNGDMEKIAAHYEREGFTEDGLAEVTKYSLAANVLSPAYWNIFQSLNAVSKSDSMQMNDPFFNLGGVRFTWDIPHYLHVDGMTLAPAVYFDTKAGVFGAQVEQAVIGEVEDEYTFSARSRYGKTYGGIAYTFNANDSTHVEATVGYDINDHFGIEMKHMVSDGETLKGFRNNHSGKSMTYVGVNIRF